MEYTESPTEINFRLTHCVGPHSEGARIPVFLRDLTDEISTEKACDIGACCPHRRDHAQSPVLYGDVKAKVPAVV